MRSGSRSVSPGNGGSPISSFPVPSAGTGSGPVVVVTCPGAGSVMSPRHAAGSIFPACPCVCQQGQKDYIGGCLMGPWCVCVLRGRRQESVLWCCARFIDRHGRPRPQPIQLFFFSLCVRSTLAGPVGGSHTHAQGRMTPQTARHALRVICNDCVREPDTIAVPTFIVRAHRESLIRVLNGKSVAASFRCTLFFCDTGCALLAQGPPSPSQQLPPRAPASKRRPIDDLRRRRVQRSVATAEWVCRCGRCVWRRWVMRKANAMRSDVGPKVVAGKALIPGLCF